MNLITLAETARCLDEIAILSNHPGYTMNIVRAVNHAINNGIDHPLCTQVKNLACIYHVEKEKPKPKRAYRTRCVFDNEESERRAFNRNAKSEAIRFGLKRYQGKCFEHNLTEYALYEGGVARCIKCGNIRYNRKPKTSHSNIQKEAA